MRRAVQARETRFQYLVDSFVIRRGGAYLFYLLYEDIDFTLKDYIGRNTLKEPCGTELDLAFLGRSLAQSLQTLKHLGLAHNNLSPENVGFRFSKQQQCLQVVLTDFSLAIVKQKDFGSTEVSFNKRDSNTKRKSSEIASMLDAVAEDEVVLICNPILMDLYGLGLVLLEFKLREFINLDYIQDYVADLSAEDYSTPLIASLLNDDPEERIKFKYVQHYLAEHIARERAKNPSLAPSIRFAEPSISELSELEGDYHALAMIVSKRRCADYHTVLNQLGLYRSRYFGHPASQVTEEEVALPYFILREAMLTYRDMGNHEQALNYLQDCLKFMSQNRALKKSEFAQLLYKGCQLQALIDAKKVDLKWYATVLGHHKRELAPGADGQMLKVLKGYGDALKAQEKYTEALACYQECLTMLSDSIGIKGPFAGRLIEQIAQVYFSLSEYDNALLFFKKSLSLKLQTYAKSHIAVNEAYNNCGECLRRLGNYEVAKKFYEKSMKLIWARKDEYQEYISYLYNNIGLCYKSLNQKKAALPLYEESLKIRRKLFGAKNIQTLQIQMNIAVLHDELGFCTKAQALYDEIIAYMVENHLEDNDLYLDVLQNKGIVMFNQGQYQKCTQFFSQVLEHKKKKYGGFHVSVANTLHNLALVHHRLGQIKKSLQLYEEALRIYHMKLSMDHPLILTLLSNLNHTKKFEDK